MILGKVSNRAVLLKCATCSAGIDSPCVHRSTGKPIKGLHKSRVRGAVADVRGPQIRKLDGMDESFWQFAWLALGGKEGAYPRKLEVAPGSWALLYKEHPDYDPANGYWGEW